MQHSLIKKIFCRNHKPLYKTEILSVLLIALPYLYMITSVILLLSATLAVDSASEVMKLLSLDNMLSFTFAAGVITWFLHGLISKDIADAYQANEKSDSKNLVKIKMDRVITVKLFLILVLVTPLILILRIGDVINLSQWAMEFCNILVSIIIFACGIGLTWMIIGLYGFNSKKYQQLEEKL
jgi:hypothetical protein